MATSSKPPVAVTDCPSCQSLCLSPTILPCGHVVCKKCFLKMLDASSGLKPACPSCGYTLSLTKGQTTDEMVDKLGKDLVLEYLVNQQLALQSQMYCMVCPNKMATKVCLNCGEFFCEACSKRRKKAAATKNHVHQNLLHTLHDAQSAAALPFKSKYESSSYHSQDSVRIDPDTRQLQNKDKESFKQEARLCQKGASLLKDAVSAMEDDIVQLQEVKNRLKNKQQLLSAYAARMFKPDDAMMTNASTMLPRVRRVLEDCHPPTEAALTKLAEHIKTLIDKPGVSPEPTTSDTMTSVPRKKFTVKPGVVGDTDKDGPFIINIVATGDGRMVMADYRNSMIKVAELTDPAQTVRGVQVNTEPYRLALLPDNQVTVTADEKSIYFVKISGQPSVESRVKTLRQYCGVASVTEDDTLVVGCEKDRDGLASVDVITRAGVVVRTVVNRYTLPGLKWPDNLCLQRGFVLVSDNKTSVVHRVELATGRVVDQLAHPEMKAPWQVTTDSDGNCYIASGNGQCVLVVSRTGQWRRLMYGPQDGDGPPVAPYGVCVTNTGIVVSWHGGHSVVVGYDRT